MGTALSRREMIARCGVCLGAAAAAASASVPTADATQLDSATEPFGYCLNTGTIRGQKLPLPEEIEIAAKAGYRGIEPWVASIQRYVEEGASLADLKKRLDDLGVPSKARSAFPAGRSTTMPSGAKGSNSSSRAWNW